MRRAIPAFLAVLTAIPVARGDNEPLFVPLHEGLALSQVGQYGRAALHRDPVLERIVHGQWSTPVEGEAVLGVDGIEQMWQPIAADDKGWITGDALRGGYVQFVYEATSPRVMMLEARGHSSVFVNGVLRYGDPYATGFVALPVLMQPGPNYLLFHVQRGRLRAQLVEAKGDAWLDLADSTWPHLVRGESDDLLAAALVVNATNRVLGDLRIDTAVEGAPFLTTSLPEIPPMSTTKVGFTLRPPAELADAAINYSIVLRRGEQEIDRVEKSMPVADPTTVHRRTFRSRIDGSVQYYGVQPALPGPETPGLVLALHGAGVQGFRQARGYQRKDWCHVIAPTNRRQFGFDWEDWGRLDAIEVLELAQSRFVTDPQRTYVTGHSMGGHGTWHLGATFPDRFAGLGPSAGWISFWSYTGAERYEDASPIESILLRATAPSDTLSLSRNYLYHGIFILHGDADDNVPVEQARLMRRHLGEFHPNFAYYERPGAGHWWGDQCMDWPPLFDWLQRSTIPDSATLKRVEFVTANPGVSAACHWLTIAQQQRQCEPSSVAIGLTERTFRGTTKNIAHLDIDLATLAAPRQAEAVRTLEPGAPIAVELDGTTIADIPWPGDRLHLQRGSGGWAVTGALAPSMKGPHRAGLFKDAFRHRPLLVYATGGTDEENAWAYTKARFDAESFWYRGNGTLQLMADDAFEPYEHPDRGVILYGCADSNEAWTKLLAGDEIRVARNLFRAGGRTLLRDDLAVLCIRPRRDSDVASVGIVAGTGPVGMRLTERMPYFVSGIGYPDVLVMDPTVLRDGAAGVHLAGFFGNDWSVETGELVWAMDR